MDAAALDALVERHWRRLFARCQLLTQDRELATDLAQETWCRVLRARETLRPDGNFPAYLRTIATNLWRDWNRTARQGRGASVVRAPSFDAELDVGDGAAEPLAEVVADPRTVEAESHAQLAVDMDRALAALSPRLREVIIARFIDEESAAEIGERYGRTEQTITAWIRQGLRELRATLDDRRES